MLTCFFVFDYDSSYYNTLKMKKELFVLVLIFFLLLELIWVPKFEAPKHGIPLPILASVSP